MMRSSRLTALLVLALALTTARNGVAQSSAATDALRRQVERRFDILPLHDGIALHPKTPGRGVRSIEITDGTISIDGAPATGGELRQKLGADADLILRLSYLDADARRAIGAPPSAPASPSTAQPPPPAAPPPAAVPPAAPESPASPLPPPPPRTRRSDERVRIGGRVVVEADEIVKDVVVIGGAARIDGQVLNDVVVVGGLLEIGPTADIGRDVSVVGGTIRRDPGAHIGGRVSHVGPGIGFHGRHFWNFAPFFVWGSMWGGFFSLMSTLMRGVVLCVLASVVLLLGGEYVERVGTRAATEPLKAGIVGVLAQLLFIPVLVVVVLFLVVIIIGIPLLVLIPFAVLAMALVFVVGFTGVAYYVGRLVSTRLGSSQRNPYLTAILGIVVVMSPVLLGRIVGLGGGLLFPITAALLFIGFLVEYMAWTIGFGAVVLNRFDRGQAQPSAPAPAA